MLSYGTEYQFSNIYLQYEGFCNHRLEKLESSVTCYFVDLMKRCSTFMVYNITVDNALEFLKFAVKFKEEKIKLKAVEVLADKFANNLEYVVDLDLNHLKDLLRYCKDSKVSQFLSERLMRSLLI